MSRPTKEESIYKISIHKNGGYMYAATHLYTVDENGNRKYVYCHWGINIYFDPMKARPA